jgi:ribosomal protein S18 acetylase RimI-like enzyme
MIRYSETKDLQPASCRTCSGRWAGCRPITRKSWHWPWETRRPSLAPGMTDAWWGLINALDDGALTAYVHYLLVRPEYQGQGVGKTLVGKIKARYEGYLYLLLLVEEKEKVAFYEKLGFGVIEGTTPVYIMNA